MVKPNISKLPTSQMMAFCQVFGLPQGGENETKAKMIENLSKVTDAQWADATVKFKVDQL